jgi:phosphatidylglycerophosphatase A
LPVKLFASGLLTGYSPVASGTVASALALGLYFLIPLLSNSLVLAILCLVTFFVGLRVSAIMESAYGHDPAEVTIDEVVGMWVSLILLPPEALIGAAAFLLFRFFDIIKPFPARAFDNKRGGLGIMMDDVIAGIYTNILLQVLVAFSVFDHLRTMF